MKLYKIRNWDSLYENNRSRAVDELTWVKIPNRHDGENFTGIMMHKEGAKIFSAFILMVEIASRCSPRGTLIRTNGVPHDVTSMSVKCRAPAVWFEVALPYLEKQTDWLEVVEVNTTDTQLTFRTSPDCQAGDEERRKERTERTEGKVGKTSPSLEEVKLCCEKTGLPESDAVWFWNKCEANGWTNNGQKIKSWPHTIAAWKAAGYMPSQKIINGKPVTAKTINDTMIEECERRVDRLMRDL